MKRANKNISFSGFKFPPCEYIFELSHRIPKGHQFKFQHITWMGFRHKKLVSIFLLYVCVRTLGHNPQQRYMSWRVLFSMKGKVKVFWELAVLPDSSLPFIPLPFSYSLFLLPNKQHSQTILLLPGAKLSLL